MNMTFKRIVCFLLVFCLLNTLPGCATINGRPASLAEGLVYVVGGVFRATALVVGDLILVGVVWVLDKITWPLYPVTGFNMDGPATVMFRFYNNLVDPNHIHGNWDEIEAELHDRHPATIWNKKKIDKTDTSQTAVETENTVPDETAGSTEATEATKTNDNVLPQTGGKTQITITYDATGGDGAPEAQMLYLGLDTTVFEDLSFESIGSFFDSAKDIIISPRIPDQKPTRSGYHFVGWTDSYNPLDDGLEEDAYKKLPQNKIRYYSCDKIKAEKEKPITGDFTLYAVWQKHEYEWKPGVHSHYVKLDIDHDLAVHRENDEKTIRIFCEECGFELIDRDISAEDFLSIWCGDSEKAFQSLSKRDQIKCNREYILYRTLDFAPLALSLIGSFYENIGKEAHLYEEGNDDVNQNEAAQVRNEALEDFGDFGEALEFAAELDLAYANSQYSKDFPEFTWSQYEHYDDYTVAYLLRNNKPEDTNALLRKSKTDFFKNTANMGKGMTYASAFARATYYGYDAFTSDKMASAKTVSLVKGIHALVDLCPYVGDYYDKLFLVLEDGLKLYDECCKEKNAYYTLLSKMIDDDGSDIPGTELNMNHIDKARNNIFLEDAPSVLSLLESLMAHPKEGSLNCYSLLSKDDQTLVVWYLSMRLEYDFKKEFGITLEDYIAYFNGDEDTQILMELLGVS